MIILFENYAINIPKRIFGLRRKCEEASGEFVPDLNMTSHVRFSSCQHVSSLLFIEAKENLTSSIQPGFRGPNRTGNACWRIKNLNPSPLLIDVNPFSKNTE